MQNNILQFYITPEHIDMVKQFIYIFLLLAIITMSLYLVYFQFIDECVEGMTLIGTFDDYADRILGSSNPEKYKQVNTAEECRDRAIERGHPFFGLENTECHTGFLNKVGNNYSPKKITDYHGNRLTNFQERYAVNQSIIPGNPYKERATIMCSRPVEKPKPQLRLPSGPKVGISSILRYGRSMYDANMKYINELNAWNKNKYTGKYENIPCGITYKQVDKITTLIGAIPNTKIQKSKTDPNLIDAGGDRKMSIYEVGKTTTNSNSSPNALTSKHLVDYFTVREGLDTGMDEVNKMYGFKVDNMNEFLPFLVKNIQMPTKVNEINTQVPIKEYKFKGYYMDGPRRTITDRMMHDSSWDKCKEAATNENKKYFAMQYGNECWMANSITPEIQLDDKTPDNIPNEQRIASQNVTTNCHYNPINQYGNKFGGSYCHAVWENVDSSTTKTDYSVTIAQYEDFIKYLKNRNIHSEAEFRNYVEINKPLSNFTTIGGSKIVEGLKNVDDNISKVAAQYGINLPMYEDIKHVDNLNKLSRMFKSISEYGITRDKLPEWTRFKQKLATIGNIPIDDMVVVNALSSFGYKTFNEINIDTFTEPYHAFKLNDTYDILDIFDKFLAIGVNGKSFATFTGENGIKKFETDKYKINASTFFVAGNDDANSLYFMFSSIKFKYNQNTFKTFIDQVQSIGEIKPQNEINDKSTQDDLKHYVLNLNINKQISPVKQFQIFIDTLNSIGITRYDTYQWFMMVTNLWLKVDIGNIQMFVLKYRYYYIFLSNGMPCAYNRAKEKKVPDFVSKEIPMDESMRPWYWYIILIFIYYTKQIPQFKVPDQANLNKFMNKVVEYGWSFDTLVTDAKIGNTFEKTTRQATQQQQQGFSTIFDSIFNSVTEMFSSISETFMGSQETFVPVDVDDENVSLDKFGVVPVNRNNADLLSLFNSYEIYEWDTIMQYIVRMNRIVIPFQVGIPGLGGLPSLPNITPASGQNPTPGSDTTTPSTTITSSSMLGTSGGENMLDIPTAEKTLELFETFGVPFSQYDAGKTGLDLFDHLMDVVKVPTSMELFKFLNKLIEFKVDYSTYYDFMEFFSENRMNLQYYGVDTNYEIFYMFIDDLIALSNNGMVLFDYKKGRDNFETLINNYQSDIFLHCVTKPPESSTPKKIASSII